MFHALTGCDTVSSFAGHGKKTAWAVWAVLPELTTGLLQLSSAPDQIPKEDMDTIERFVILLYDRTSTCQDVDKARKKLFTRRHNVELIPPTKAALEEHYTAHAVVLAKRLSRCGSNKELIIISSLVAIRPRRSECRGAYACEEGYLPRRSRVGASTATCTSAAFANRLGVDKK